VVLWQHFYSLFSYACKVITVVKVARWSTPSLLTVVAYFLVALRAFVETFRTDYRCPLLPTTVCTCYMRSSSS